MSQATNQTHAVSTWPPIQDSVTALDRPHTISTTYEKGHQRPPLTVYTFQNPDGSTNIDKQQPAQKSPTNVVTRPPLPIVSAYLNIKMTLSIEFSLFSFNYSVVHHCSDHCLQHQMGETSPSDNHQHHI